MTINQMRALTISELRDQVRIHERIVDGPFGGARNQANAVLRKLDRVLAEKLAA